MRRDDNEFIRRSALREQMSNHEIAKRIGLSHNTVENYLRVRKDILRGSTGKGSSKPDTYAEKFATWLAIEATKSRKTSAQSSADPDKEDTRLIHTVKPSG